MNNTYKATGVAGISFAQLISIVFIVLKLTGKITWSWWVVLLPLWAPVAIALLISVIMFIVCNKKCR